MSKLLAGQRSSSYGHRCRYVANIGYEITWTMDTKHRRIRFPYTQGRWTDEVGAHRFCKKWDIPFPEDRQE